MREGLHITGCSRVFIIHLAFDRQKLWKYYSKLDPQEAQIFSKEAARPGSAKFRLKAADCHGHSKASSE